MEWYPIATAPMDEPVMAYVPEGMWGNGNPYLMVEWSKTMSVGGSHWWTIDDACSVEPTHWCRMEKPELMGNREYEKSVRNLVIGFAAGYLLATGLMWLFWGHG